MYLWAEWSTVWEWNVLVHTCGQTPLMSGKQFRNIHDSVSDKGRREENDVQRDKMNVRKTKYQHIFGVFHKNWLKNSSRNYMYTPCRRIYISHVKQNKLIGNQAFIKGSVRCFPGPIFPSPYVPRYMILVSMFSMFPSPYVIPKCFPVPLLPELILPSPCVPQYPWFPYFPVSMFPIPCAPQSICFRVPIYVHQSIWSPVPMFPPTNSPVPMFPTHNPQMCFQFCMCPKPVPQCLCSPVPMFSSPYVPPTSSSVTIFGGGTHLGRVAHISSIIRVIIVSQKTRTREHRDWWTGWGDTWTEEHWVWGTRLGNIGTGGTSNL